VRRALLWISLLVLAGLVDLGVAAEGIARGAGDRAYALAPDVATIGRLIVLGFDGADPEVLSERMAAGDMPACAALVRAGGLHRLQSETPPESPVAWASLQTGRNPGETAIFDFVGRDPKVSGYRPTNGMVDLAPPPFLFGKIPTRPPRVASRLAARTFLERVAEAGYRVLGIRPPLTFPVASLPHARILSGLGTPDLAGTNGAYAIYSSDQGLGREYTIFNGHRIHLEGGSAATSFNTYLEGPFDRRRRDDEGGYSRVTVPLRFERAGPGAPVTVVLDGVREVLAPGATGSWMRVAFPLPTWPTITFRGRVRFTVQQPPNDPTALVVLADPVQIDPRDPALPISTPAGYAGELEQAYGAYPTMGWLEPTFPLNDRNLTDEAFLKHVLELMDHDHAILLGELARPANLVFHVFTQTDRAAHCFWWLRDPGHPFYDAAAAARWAGRDPLTQVYRRMDAIIGDVVARLGPRDRLLVVSDHGFQSFRYGMNVNQWLINEGYLVMKQAEVGEHDLTDFFGEHVSSDAVDWSKSRAYALGLGQVYLNRKGREPEGIVGDAEVPGLLQEMRAKLLALKDAEHGDAQVLSKVYVLSEVYRGAHVAEAGELQLGFAKNYRVSWQTALMGDLHPPGTPILEPNLYPWSGDHCSTDPDLVPGILLSSAALPQAPEGRRYHVRDVAATVLEHFGIDHADLDGEATPLPFAPTLR